MVGQLTMNTDSNHLQSILIIQLRSNNQLNPSVTHNALSIKKCNKNPKTKFSHSLSSAKYRAPSARPDFTLALLVETGWGSFRRHAATYCPSPKRQISPNRRQLCYVIMSSSLSRGSRRTDGRGGKSHNNKIVIKLSDSLG